MIVGANNRACLEVRLPGEPASVPRARHLVRDLLVRQQLGEHPGVLLSVSEACTNAIVHAYPDADGDVDLEARADGSLLHVSVRDYGIGMETPVRRGGRGYGMLLIKAHAVSIQIRDCDPGTEVAMTFDLSAPQEEPA
jgi:anti-sigma regulatory factor (Ser/Thr protein kinase)